MNLFQRAIVFKDMSTATRLTDQEIFTQCQRGNALAWEQFVRTHQQRIFGLASAYTRSYEDTRDLAQEIFIKLYRNLGKCRSLDMLKPWMMTVGRNTAIDHLRRQYRQPLTTMDTLVLDSARSHEPSPEQNYEIQSRRELLRRGMDRLSVLLREVIMLKDIQELSLLEIAEILDVPMGTVKSRLHNARVELSKIVMELCRSEVCNVTI